VTARDELAELLRPRVELVTYHDLYSSTHDHRVPAGPVIARASATTNWVRVWAADRTPQDGVTVALETLAAALDSHLVTAKAATS